MTKRMLFVYDTLDPPVSMQVNVFGLNPDDQASLEIFQLLSLYTTSALFPLILCCVSAKCVAGLFLLPITE